MDNVLTVVLAANKNWLIGKNQKLPWRLKADLNSFKAITIHENVVMGKNTYNSLPKNGLPGRDMYVFSKTIERDDSKFTKLTKFTELESIKNPYIVGGAELYNRYIPKCDVLYITRVDCDEYNGTRINPIDFSRFYLVAEYPFLELRPENNSHRFVIQKWVSKRHFKKLNINKSEIITNELSIWEDYIEDQSQN